MPDEDALGAEAVDTGSGSASVVAATTEEDAALVDGLAEDALAVFVLAAEDAPEPELEPEPELAEDDEPLPESLATAGPGKS